MCRKWPKIDPHRLKTEGMLRGALLGLVQSSKRQSSGASLVSVQWPRLCWKLVFLAKQEAEVTPPHQLRSGSGLEPPPVACKEQ